MEKQSLRLCLLPIVFSLFLLSTSCDQNENKQFIDFNEKVSDKELRTLKSNINHDRLRFGFDIRLGPQEDAKQYLPFLDYLSRRTGYKFSLLFSHMDGSIVDDLVAGKVDFAVIGAGSFIKARQQSKIIPVVRGLNTEGKSGYQSILVAKKNSKLKQISDLPGKRLGFGSVTSTQGHLIPRILLHNNKILLRDLAKYEYFGSHLACAEAVITDRVDMCGMQDTLAKKMASEGKVKIIHTSKFYPSSGIAAREDIANDVLKKVRDALLDFEPHGRDSVGLYHWEMTEMPKGFGPATVKDYAELEKWAFKLGLIE